MTNQRVMLMFVLGFFVTFAAHAATAQCFKYTNGDPTECWGTNCQSQYIVTYCDFGCQAQFCTFNGNSLNCCGQRIDYAQAFGPCHDCGQPEIRIHVRASRPNRDYRAELLQGYSPGLIMLSATKSYRPPELAEIFIRCSHAYRLFVREGQIVATEGM